MIEISNSENKIFLIPAELQRAHFEVTYDKETNKKIEKFKVGMKLPISNELREFFLTAFAVDLSVRTVNESGEPYGTCIPIGRLETFEEDIIFNVARIVIAGSHSNV